VKHDTFDTLPGAQPGDTLSPNLWSGGPYPPVFYDRDLEIALRAADVIAVADGPAFDDGATLYERVTCDGCGADVASIHASPLDGESYCPRCAAGLVRWAQETLGRFISRTTPAPAPEDA
jgi:hypothetical protein